MKADNEIVEIVASTVLFRIDKLYFMISDKPPKDIPKAFYFNIDHVRVFLLSGP